MRDHLYYYAAKVVSVYDGDTVRTDIDLGLSTWVKKEKIRLARINAPEVRGKERPEGLKARDFLSDLILDKDIFLQTQKDKKGKYGRYLGELWVEKDGKWINVNDLMVESGHAVYVHY
ncbi:MAG TPA: nuclease [Caldithrix sp.]|nr:nuclease [Caldithrix sp.]